MKYVLMMHTPPDGYRQFVAWSKEELEANGAFMAAFGRRLADAGELVCTWGLDAPQQAKRVRVDRDGKPITDGVFPEAKEFLAGFWVVDVDGPERAHALAAEVLGAPHGSVVGPDGAPWEMTIEVRRVMGSRSDLD